MCSDNYFRNRCIYCLEFSGLLYSLYYHCCCDKYYKNPRNLFFYSSGAQESKRILTGPKLRAELGTSLVVQWIRYPAPNAGDLGLIPGLGRSPEKGKGYQLQFSGLEISMDCIVPGVTNSQTQLSNFHDLNAHFNIWS